MAETKAASENEAAFSEIADRLYALRPDDFAAARDDAVKKAKGAGDKGLAEELRQLRKPTQSAWLINLLTRDEPDAISAWLELAGDLSHALSAGDVRELQRAAERRRDLETDILRRAGALAQGNGLDISTALERDIQGTLAAALASEEMADEVRGGRLVKPLSYAGFGAMALIPTAPPPRVRESRPAEAPARDKEPEAPPRATATKQAPATDRRRAAHEEDGERKKREGQDRDRKAAEGLERKAREDLERQVRKARELAEDAAEALELRRRMAQTTRRRLERAQAEVEDVRKRLASAETELESVERAASNADDEQAEADRAHEAALAALEEAERALRGAKP